jgi:two-component system, OmpR family, alkaline phosphatase synthesis response regulator PhoP
VEVALMGGGNLFPLHNSLTIAGDIRLMFETSASAGIVMKDEKILIVDDERDIVDFVRAYLEKEGYQTFEAYDGESAWSLWKRYHPSLIVLDVLMPRLNGLELCRRVRRESNVPIIILSAKSEEEDRLDGLDIGADDYMIKPFSPRELVARIRAILRRGTQAFGSGLIVEGPLAIDLDAHKVTVLEEEISLTLREMNILASLASRSPQVLSRDQLLMLIDGDDYDGYGRNVDTHIKNIRRKIAKKAKGWNFIETVYGVGYRFQAKKKD